VLNTEQKKVAKIRGRLSNRPLRQANQLPIEESVQPEQNCSNPSWEDLSGLSGSTSLCWNKQFAAELFPYLATHFPIVQMAFLLTMTRIVGMHCPGLRSVFSDLSISFKDHTANTQAEEVLYEVKQTDERFNLLEVSINSSIADGTVNAFYRSQAVEQASFSEVQNQVEPKSFCDRKILVIGGNRGLGEAIAKICSAGDAIVTLTYNQGRSDAYRVVEEITSERKQCHAVQLNILNLDERQWQSVYENGPFDVVFYFATPHSELNPWRSWRKVLFNQYCQYYLDNFQITVQLLLKHAHGDRNKLVFVQPSTVFVEKPEAGTAEYAAAKAAMESMSMHLEAEHTLLSVITPRLARLQTDQTGALDLKQVDPVLPAMIELVNECFLRLRGK